MFVKGERIKNMYESVIEKAAIYIKGIKVIDLDTINAFEISSVLSIIFDKPKEVIIKDIVDKVRDFKSH